MSIPSPLASFPHGQATQADVARAAGVSRALVGIVFRGEPGASQENRDHIRAVAAKIGYVPDTRAQHLSRKRSGIIGVTYSLRHDFHSTTVEHLYLAAERAGLSLVLSGFGTTRSEDSAVASLLAYRCEGLVLIGSGCPARDLERIAGRIPTIVTFRPVKRPGVGVVRTDDLGGSQAATEHLIELGHRRLIHVNGGRSPGATDRRKGFRRTAVRHGAAVDELTGGSTEADGFQAGRQLVQFLSHPRPPTAAVVFNDPSAVGVMAAIRGAGYRVPEDISIVGFDDSQRAGVPGVDLTTMRQNTASLAENAIKQLADRILDREQPAAETVVPAELIVRLTTGVPRLAEAS